MNTSFTSKQIRLGTACALTLSCAFGSVQAADFGAGAAIWRNTNAEIGARSADQWCWNRAFGAMIPPSGCELQPLAQDVVPAPAPAVVAQAPAPASVPAQYVAPAPTQPAPPAVRSERPPKSDRN